MLFEFSTAGRIVFGAGVAESLGDVIAQLGTRPFLVTGRSPVRCASTFDTGVPVGTFGVSAEPSVEIAQTAVGAAREADSDVVVAVGGGSVIDTGKVVAAMLANDGELLDYLEVVGPGHPLQRPAAPYIAVPTTAGTGAEVTRNAVLSVPAENVKVSMRSRFLLPRVALVDPLLTHSMPPQLTAATGLDALTQLVEAFVSNKANPLTDGICREGLRRAGRSLRRAFEDGDDADAREDMALASLFGGLALANAKLGAVHGFAGPLGGMIDVPHGVVCGKLLPFVTEANVRALRDRAPESAVLARYGEVARLLTGCDNATAADLVAWTRDLCAALGLPGLRRFGLREDHFPAAIAKAVKASSMKGNPIRLSDDELTEILVSACD
jgi:alcohol dehydrogenase class IV